MVEIFGKFYYIDIYGLDEKCKTGDVVKNENGEESLEINIFKYEVLKMCIERILNDFQDIDDEMGPFGQNDTSVSFKIAFNTLIKNEILIEDYE